MTLETVGAGEPATQNRSFVTEIRRILAVLAQHDRFLTSARSNRPRQFAAAALARCRALLDGMCTLDEHARTDVSGVLGRSLLETWLVGTYVLLKNDDLALNEILAGYARAGRVMNDRLRFGEKFTAMMEGWIGAVGAETRMPSYEDLAARVRDLLKAIGEDLDTKRAYDVLYRAQSTFDAHGGAGSVLRHINYDPTGAADSIVENPGPAIDRQEIIATALLCLLARLVFKEFGVVVQGLAEAWEEFATLVKD